MPRLIKLSSLRAADGAVDDGADMSEGEDEPENNDDRYLDEATGRYYTGLGEPDEAEESARLAIEVKVKEKLKQLKRKHEQFEAPAHSDDEAGDYANEDEDEQPAPKRSKPSIDDDDSEQNIVPNTEHENAQEPSEYDDMFASPVVVQMPDDDQQPPAASVDSDTIEANDLLSSLATHADQEMDHGYEQQPEDSQQEPSYSNEEKAQYDEAEAAAAAEADEAEAQHQHQQHYHEQPELAEGAEHGESVEHKGDEEEQQQQQQPEQKKRIDPDDSDVVRRMVDEVIAESMPEGKAAKGGSARAPKTAKPPADLRPGRPLTREDWLERETDDEKSSRMPEFCPMCEYTRRKIDVDGSEDFADMSTYYRANYHYVDRFTITGHLQFSWDTKLRKLIREEVFHDLPWRSVIIDDHFHKHVRIPDIVLSQRATCIEVQISTLENSMMVPDSAMGLTNVLDLKRSKQWQSLVNMHADIMKEIEKIRPQTVS